MTWGHSGAIDRLVAHIESATGIALARGGRAEAVERVVSERMRELGVATVEAYLQSLSAAGSELRRLVNAITVNYTWFFRDLEQMEALRSLLRLAWGSGRALEIWVAACSTGDDAYTVAMLADSVGRQVRILGTDINSDALAHASEGRYGAWSMRDLPQEMQRNVRKRGSGFEVVPDLRRQVRFERHNLIEPPPMAPGGRGWDLVLCRNVLIYFTPERGLETLDRMSASLADDGWMTLGGSEVIHVAPERLRIARVGNRVAMRLRSAPVAELVEQPLTPVAVAPAPEAPAPPSVAPPEPAPTPQAVAPPLPVDLSQEATLLAALEAGNAALEDGDPAKAVTLYHKAIERDPLCAEAQMFIGIAHHQLGDLDGAAEALRGALFLEPTLWPAAFYMALCYDSQGRGAEAVRAYHQVLDAARLPSKIRSGGQLVRNLEAWKKDMTALARKRAQKSR
jgi:chemotaxis protein methyltransferase CheR